MSFHNKLPYILSKSNQIESFQIFKDHELGVSDFCQNKLKSNEVATASFDTTIKIFDIDKLQNVKTLNSHNKGVWTLDYSCTDRYLLSAGNDNKIILWDSTTYNPIQEINYHEEVIYDVKFSSNGKYFASCSKGMICLWDINNLKEPLSCVKDHQNEFIFSVNFINNDKHLVSGLIDGNMILVDIKNVNDNKKYFIPRIQKSSYYFEEIVESNSIYHISKFKSKSKSQDDEVITALDDGSIMFWKYEDGELKNEPFKYNYFTAPVTCVNSSFDDQMLIAGSKDHSALVWRTSEESKVDYSLIGHSDIITCADFISNDLVATTSYDTSFRLWKLN